MMHDGGQGPNGKKWERKITRRGGEGVKKRGSHKKISRSSSNTKEVGEKIIKGGEKKKIYQGSGEN